MRCLALLLAACLLPLAAQAAPFLVADVAPEADTCTITGLPAAVTATVPEAAGTCRWDLAGIPVGSYSATATAANLWGASAPSAPFAFTRPASTSTPAGLRLVP